VLEVCPVGQPQNPPMQQTKLFSPIAIFSPYEARVVGLITHRCDGHSFVTPPRTCIRAKSAEQVASIASDREADVFRQSNDQYKDTIRRRNGQECFTGNPSSQECVLPRVLRHLGMHTAIATCYFAFLKLGKIGRSDCTKMYLGTIAGQQDHRLQRQLMPKTASRIVN
jgi:hypothetical protein